MGRAKGANTVRAWLRRSAGVAGAMALAAAPGLVAQAAQGHTMVKNPGAVAAVIHHVASRIVGQPPLKYFAYMAKTPSDDLWNLVSDVSHLQPMPPTWKPNLDDQIELVDVYDVRSGKAGATEVAVQIVGAVGLAVEACIYVARLKGGSWQVDSEATRCLVL
jgi:hypothetical protein